MNKLESAMQRIGAIIYCITDDKETLCNESDLESLRLAIIALREKNERENKGV